MFLGDLSYVDFLYFCSIVGTYSALFVLKNC